jgi:predicted flap endonuclease-1-like 5' DNA nuclease
LYTLSTWALWLVVAALIGGVIGWLLRSIGRMKNVDEHAVGAVRAEADQLRGRIADLESANTNLQRAADDQQAQRVLAPPTDPTPLGIPVPIAPAPDTTVLAERDELAQQLAEQRHWVSELRVRLWNSEARNRDLQAVVDSHVVAAAPPDPDLGDAARVLGMPVRLNDLTVIEGIGPAIAHLCINRGVTTWWSMANADTSLLRSMLAEAGPKYQIHDPTSWPQQARLLANGQWEKFQRLADALRDGNDAE